MITRTIRRILSHISNSPLDMGLYLFVATSMTAVYFFYISTTQVENNFGLVIQGGLIFASTIFLLFQIISLYSRTITDHPRALSIALVGPPNAGKTVYLTMLYKELETKEIQGLSFAPYGSRTIEVVARNIARMEQGEFPPPTGMESSFRYEAVASFSRRFATQKYRIQISDYAGEHLKEFDDAHEMWLHHTDYFEYVVSADALLFMLDCETLLNGDSIPHLQSILIGTVHTFIERRRSDPTKPSNVPVALLFSKSDVLSSKEDIEKVTSQVSRLIAVCKKRFRYFRYFLVSSVGVRPELNDKGDPIPPSDMEPVGVVEPLIWLLGK